ncbi:SRPBCC family protein [Branchiibius sp. NY16-3462-2]|uniref:SRPBCC family protein n=1 Tax=Branchiibius sp. NY16-3462-2 TaxID=1807500 RepID=UPI000792A677|nr:SRPBCC family protein [Branchiibius sp. NY16-3462-2]KYH45978.1 hypothetical protein AZH51_09975 [Branchiibius sp. NY16-3462-2]
MTSVTVRAHSTADPGRLWRAASEFARHSAYFPFTKVTVTSGAGDQVGDTIVGTTRIGPVTLADPMTITTYDAPQAYAVRKTGSVLTGEVHVQVHPHGDGSQVVWTADVVPAWRWARIAGPVNTLISRAVYQHAVSAMARTAESLDG